MLRARCSTPSHNKGAQAKQRSSSNHIHASQQRSHSAHFSSQYNNRHTSLSTQSIKPQHTSLLSHSKSHYSSFTPQPKPQPYNPSLSSSSSYKHGLNVRPASVTVTVSNNNKNGRPVAFSLTCSFAPSHHQSSNFWDNITVFYGAAPPRAKHSHREQRRTSFNHSSETFSTGRYYAKWVRKPRPKPKAQAPPPEVDPVTDDQIPTGASAQQLRIFRVSTEAGLILMMLILMVAVFLLWGLSSTNNRLRLFMHNHFLASWRNLQEGRFHTLLTSAFSHEGFLHLLFSGLILFGFGPAVIQNLGVPKFLTLVGTSAVVSSLGQLLYPALGQRMFRNQGVLGSSGFLSAMFTYLAITQPGINVSFFFIPIPIPIRAAVGGMMAYDAYCWVTGNELLFPGVAHAGHLFGGLVGVAFVYAGRRRMMMFRPRGTHG